MSADLVCDFCLKPNPRWSFPAPTQVVDDDHETMAHISHGGWAACTACSNLIRHRNTAALIVRAANGVRRMPPFVPFAELPPEAREALIDRLTKLYAGVLPTLGERKTLTRRPGDGTATLGTLPPPGPEANFN